MNAAQKITVAVALASLFGVLVTAMTAILNNRIAVLQKAEADARDAWWKRSQWAMERACDTDPLVRSIGLTVLQRMKDSSLTKPEDRKMIAAVAASILIEGKT